jgi:hypothetical protein
MSKYGGTVLKTSLSKDGEKELRMPCMEPPLTGWLPSCCPAELGLTAGHDAGIDCRQAAIIGGRAAANQSAGTAYAVLIVTYLLSASGEHAGCGRQTALSQALLLLALRTAR